MDVDPATLQQVTGQLDGASQGVEGGASEPPVPQAGTVIGLVGAYLAQLCQAMGNVSSGAAGLADAVAKGKDLYVSTDGEQAARVAAAESPE